MRQMKISHWILFGMLAAGLVVAAGCYYTPCEGQPGGAPPGGAKPGEGELKPLEFKLNELTWKYDIQTKWNPFEVPPPPAETALGGSTSEPYDLDQMQLLGVIEGSGASGGASGNRAYVLQVPDNKVRIIQVGHVLGIHGGIVIAIGMRQSGATADGFPIYEGYLTVKERIVKPGGPEDDYRPKIVDNNRDLVMPARKPK